MGAPASAQTGDDGPVTFTALTYNVAGLPEGLSSSKPTANSPLISPKLNAYDLVLLQEDWGEPIDIGGMKILFHHDAVVADADHAYRTDPAPAPLGLDLDRLPTGPPLIADGLNRLSRFPFDGPNRQKWARCSGELTLTVLEEVFSAIGLGDEARDLGIYGGATDCNAQKGFAMARTTFGDGLVVDVYNLHAEAGSGPADNAARAHNYQQLAAFIEAHSAGNAIILGGDTNLHAAGPNVRPQDREIWETFQARTGVIDVCATLDCGPDVAVIDRFAIRSGDSVSVTALSHRFERDVFVGPGGRPLSDHDALAVQFTVAAVSDTEAEPAGGLDASSDTSEVAAQVVGTASSGALPATGGSQTVFGFAIAVSAAVVALRRRLLST